MLSLPPTLLSAAMVAVIAVAYLALRKVIDWEDVKGVSWGTFLIGAGLSLGDALGRSGAADWLATLIGPLVTGPPFLVSLLALALVSAIFTNLMNNTTIRAIAAVAEAPVRWPLYLGETRRYVFPTFPFSLVYFQATPSLLSPWPAREGVQGTGGDRLGESR